MVRTRLYRDGQLEADDFPLDECSDHLDKDDTVVWLDLTSPSKEEYERVQEEFGLHRLAIEDSNSTYERPKLSRYDNHLFLNAYAVTFESDSGELLLHEVSMFATKRALITVHDDDFDIDAVTKRWDDTPEEAGHGVAYLVHGLLDLIVDGHFDVVQQLDEALEELESKLFEETPESIRAVQQRTFRVRKAVVKLRKVVVPMRELASGLMRPNTALVDDELMPYYQDLYDHTLRAAEWTESLRDFVSSILESNLGVQSNRMNNVMKKVTSWAAIIAVPTAVTGYYGQNVPFPGYQQHSGVIVSAVLLIGLSVGLYVTFKRKGWL